MKTIISMLMCLCYAMNSLADTPPTHTRLSGKVTDAVDGEPLIGVTLHIAELSKTAVTDTDGTYEFDKLPAKHITIQVSYVGHQTIIRQIDLSTTTRADFVMHESNAMIDEVVVTGITGGTLTRESPTPVSIVSHRDLLTASSTNIVDAIAHKPGMAQITTGNGISKPVIRGLGYNRIVTVADGIRQEGQQWGDEHGIEVDAQSVQHIEILKGPASLMYGSDAMAGVVIFHTNPTLASGQIQGSVDTEYQTNSGLWAYSLQTGGNKQGTIWDIRYSGKMAHAYKNAYDGYVLGSQMREQALRGMVGLNRQWGYSHVILSYYHFTPGMVEGERDEETGQFIMPINNNGEEGEAIANHHALTTYGHGFPYQQIHHYKAVWDHSAYIGDGTLKLTLGYQQNRRQEFEEVTEPDESGLDFLLHTMSYDLRYTLQQAAEWRLAAGIGGMWQRSLNKGEECLIPAYVLNDMGAYATASRQWGTWNMSGGLRIDRRHLHSFANEELFNQFSRTFHALTGSIGAVYTLSSKSQLRLNMARGFRAPNLSELGSNGEHEGTFRYEIGNTDLRPEYSWQADAGYDFNSPIVSAQASLFINFISHFTFAHRLAGKEIDELPVYQFTQGDARLWGGEMSVDIHPIEPLHFENTFSYVNATLQHQPSDRKYLPFTPAPRWTSELSLELIRDGKLLNNTYIKVGLECFLRQNHFYGADETETATPSYTLLSLSAGTDIRNRKHTLCTLALNADNLTDRAYQNHLSRLKYAAMNPVTGRRGIYNMGRNFSIKVSVPIF
jgi:iron complex outermembrane receptor protein